MLRLYASCATQNSNASQPHNLKKDCAMVSSSSLKISTWMHTGNESQVETISCPFQQLWPLTQKSKHETQTAARLF